MIVLAPAATRAFPTDIYHLSMSGALAALLLDEAVVVMPLAGKLAHQELTEIGEFSYCAELLFTRDGLAVVAGGQGGDVGLFHVYKGAGKGWTAQLGDHESVVSVCELADGRILTTHAEGAVVALERGSGEVVAVAQAGAEGEVANCAVGVDAVEGMAAVLGMSDGSVRAIGADLAATRHNKATLGKIAVTSISSAGRELAVGLDNGSVKILGLPDLAVLHDLKKVLPARITTLRHSPNAQLLVACSDQCKHIQVIRNGAVQWTLRGHNQFACDAAFTGDSQGVITSASDETLRVWWLYPTERKRVISLLSAIQASAERQPLIQGALQPLIARVKRAML